MPDHPSTDAPQDNAQLIAEREAALRRPIGSIGPTRARALERLRRELGRENALDLLIA